MRRAREIEEFECGGCGKIDVLKEIDGKNGKIQKKSGNNTIFDVKIGKDQSEMSENQVFRRFSVQESVFYAENIVKSALFLNKID